MIYENFCKSSEIFENSPKQFGSSCHVLKNITQMEAGQVTYGFIWRRTEKRVFLTELVEQDLPAAQTILNLDELE